MRFLKKIFKKALLACAMTAPSVYAIAQEAQYTTQGTIGNDISQQLFASEISTAKKLLDLIAEFFVKYSFQVLGGIIVVMLGVLAAKFITNFVEKLLEKRNVDVAVIKFVNSIIKILVITFALIIALGKFGITIAPFIAGLSVIGFGTSFALQGPLSNYATGASLIFTKPFRVGDNIEVADVAGEVQDMTLSRTVIKTLDDTTIYIPNKHIIGEIIQNYTEHKKLDMVFGVSYSSDVGKALEVVKKVIDDDDRISKEHKPRIGITEFADSSINIHARLWCKQDDYYDAKFGINKKMFDEFAKNNIEIPFPQRDVHLYKKEG